MRHLNWRLGAGLACLMTAGCPGDDGGTDSGADTGDGTGSETGGTSQTTTGSASMTGASGSQSGTGTSSTSEATTSTSDGTSTAATDDGMTTGGKDECSGLDRAACIEAEACAPIACRPYMMSDNVENPWCLQEPEYLGCQSADIACGDAETVACPGDTDGTYLCPDTCLPAGFSPCDPPTQEPVESCQGA